MDKVTRITISIPGENKHVAPDVMLADLVRKLRGIDLTSGQHEIIIFRDGSVVLDAAMAWEPAQSPVVSQQSKRKVG